jgi:hypothetical protein
MIAESTSSIRPPSLPFLNSLRAPDPVVSDGGIIAAVAREIDHLTEPEIEGRLVAIGGQLAAILDESARRGQPPLTVTRTSAGRPETG